MANTSVLPDAVKESLDKFNADNKTDWSWGQAWDKGSNWSNEKTRFDTYLNNYLFPKVAQTTLAQQNLGNRFDFLAKEVSNMTAVLREDYVVLDSVPAGLNLSKPEENMLKVNYPKIATKLFAGNNFLKEKFTLNDNDALLNFQTIGDSISYAMAVYQKRVSDINMFEEQIIKAMLVDYGLNQVKDQRTVKSRDELVSTITEAILNMQNNSALHNEADKASGGAVGRYSTYTPLNDIFILTTDTIKSFLLDSIIANTFQVAGIDITDRVISFDDLGGTYRTKSDVKITEDDSKKYLRGMGLYETDLGDVFYTGTTIPFPVDNLKEFKGNVEEIKPKGDLFALVCDVNSVGYKRKTAGMLKRPFYNGERDEWTYWLHYQAQRYIRPFFNKICITGNSGMNPADKHVGD